MDLLHLRTFLEVAKGLNFTRAATRLGYVQSTVSAHVRALEDELGVQLFDRLGRRIRLTPAGETLLGEAADLVTRADAAERATRLAAGGDGRIAGRIVIGAPESLLSYRLPPLIGRYHRQFPEVDLSFRPVATGRLRGEVERLLIEGSIDVAFVMDERLPPRGRVSTETLWNEPISVIAPPDHPLVGARGLTPRALGNTTVLLSEAIGAGCAYRTQFVDQLRAIPGQPRELLEFASVEAVKQCVAAGMGISALPTAAVAADLESGRLRALTWGRFAIFTHVAWNPRRWQSPAVSAVLDLARETAREAADLATTA